jgi:hypothetical protein
LIVDFESSEIRMRTGGLLVFKIRPTPRIVFAVNGVVMSALGLDGTLAAIGERQRTVLIAIFAVTTLFIAVATVHLARYRLMVTSRGIREEGLWGRDYSSNDINAIIFARNTIVIERVRNRRRLLGFISDTDGLVRAVREEIARWPQIELVDVRPGAG